MLYAVQVKSFQFVKAQALIPAWGRWHGQVKSAEALDVPRQVTLVADPSKIRLRYTLVMWQVHLFTQTRMIFYEPTLSSQIMFINLTQFLVNKQLLVKNPGALGYPGWTFMGRLVDGILLDSSMIMGTFYDSWCLLWTILWWLFGWTFVMIGCY